MSLPTRLLAAAVVLFAGPAAARDAKPVDLSDLRDAVKAASKRGSNVDEVRKALDAAEAALGKGWTAPKPGDPPPAEFAALRDAVEAAARKGENVDGIRTELDAVEKTLLGRTLTAARPELPPLGTPKEEPDLPPFRRGGRGFIRGGGGVVIVNGGQAGVVQSVVISGESFVITSGQGGVKYVVTGRVGDGPDAAKVTIAEGDKKTEYEGLKKVPEEHREAVERLLKSVRGR